MAKIVKADPSVIDDNSTGRTALHEAVQSNHDEIGKILLDHGANPNVRDYSGQTPLHDAALTGAVSFGRLLIERGAVVDAYGRGDVSPLGWALFSGADGAAECASLLREAGAAEDLITAIYSGDDELIRNILAEKSQDQRHRRQLARCIPDLIHSWRNEALRAWTRMPEAKEEVFLSQVVAKHLPILDLLLGSGAQLGVPGMLRLPGLTVAQTAVYEALCSSGSQDILIRPLLERGADPNERDSIFRSPLKLARHIADVGPNRAVAALLEYGANE